MSDIMNPTPIGFSIIDNGIDIAFGIQTNVDSAFVFKDSIVFNNKDDFFKLQIDDEIMKRMQKQKDVLLVTFGLSGPMDEYMIQL